MNSTSHLTLAETFWLVSSGAALLGVLSAEIGFVVWLWQATGP